MERLQEVAVPDPRSAKSCSCTNAQLQTVDKLTKTANYLTMNKPKPPPGPWELAVIAQIAAERAASGMTVGELAQRVGVHPHSMPRYMKGERELGLTLVERFANALGVDIHVFLRRVEERQNEASRRHLQSVRDDLDA